MFFSGGFTYGEYDSSQHKLEFLRIDFNEMNTVVSEKSYSTVRNQSNSKHYITGGIYENPLTFDAEIVCLDDVLDDKQSREVCRQLFNSNEYRWLKLKNDEWKDIHLNCVMVLQSDAKHTYGKNNKFGVVGYKVTIICDAPFAWEDYDKIDIISSKNATDSDPYILVNDSDYEKYTYPTVYTYAEYSINNDKQTPIEIFLSMKDPSKKYYYAEKIDYYNDIIFNIKINNDIMQMKYDSNIMSLSETITGSVVEGNYSRGLTPEITINNEKLYARTLSFNVPTNNIGIFSDKCNKTSDEVIRNQTIGDLIKSVNIIYNDGHSCSIDANDLRFSVVYYDINSSILGKKSYDDRDAHTTIDSPGGFDDDDVYKIKITYYIDGVYPNGKSETFIYNHSNAD